MSTLLCEVCLRGGLTCIVSVVSFLSCLMCLCCCVCACFCVFVFKCVVVACIIKKDCYVFEVVVVVVCVCGCAWCVFCLVYILLYAVVFRIG